MNIKPGCKRPSFESTSPLTSVSTTFKPAAKAEFMTTNKKIKTDNFALKEDIKTSMAISRHESEDDILSNFNLDFIESKCKNTKIESSKPKLLKPENPPIKVESNNLNISVKQN